jgi:hypothetical protein
VVLPRPGLAVLELYGLFRPIASAHPENVLCDTDPDSIGRSAHYLALEHAKDDSHDWLKCYQRLKRAGRSIFFVLDTLSP